MNVSFVSTGYIEVWKGAALVSRHRVEREAIESVLKRGGGRYEMRFPTVRVEVTEPQGVINGGGTL